MGIREKLNENPAITTGITAGIIVIALIIIVYQLVSSGGPRIPTKAYFTVDDGATWFEDDINKLSPFEHKGQTAYRVHVFRCEDGEKFAAYLERFTPEALKKLEAARAAGDQADPAIYEEVSNTGVEVKKPGESKWVKQADYEKSAQVTSPLCKDGTTQGIEPVYP